MKNMRRRIGIGLMIACSWILLAAEAGAQPGSLDYAGFSHTPLGGATLSINPDGNLEVSNIGSSGLDGVRIAWTSPDAFLLKLGTVLSAPTEPTGTMLDVVIEGSLSGLFGSVTCTDIGSVFDFVVDYTPMGSSTYTLKILDTASQINLNLSGYSGGQNGTQQPESIASALLPDGNLCIMFMWDSPNTINVPGVGTFTAAAMMMISEIPPSPAQSLPTEELFGNYHFLLEVSGVQPGPIVDETLTQFKNIHRALGAALLSVNPGGTLTVSNIGSSGLDGVSIDLAPAFSLSDSTADTVSLEFEFGTPFDPNPPGTVLSLEADGKIKWTNPPKTATSSVSLTSSPGTTNIVMDFQGIQALSARVEIINDGVLVSSRVVSMSAPVATIGPASAGDPQVTSILAAAVIPMFSDKASLPGFRIKFDRDATITPTGFIPEIGDEVLIVAHDPGGPVDSLTAVRLIANNSPPIAIISEPTIRGESIGGIPHTLLGEADSQSSDTDGDGFPDEIEVSNIGSSGLDGVAISIGQAQGWTGEVDFGPAGGLAPGMSARFAMTTSPFIVGNDPPEVSLVVSDDGGGGGRMALDYPSAVDGSTVYVRLGIKNDGVVGDEVTHPHPFPALLVAGNIGSSGLDGVRFYAFNDSAGNQRILVFELPAATSLTATGGGGTVVADAIRFVLTTPGQAYDPDDPLEIKFTASNFSPATISGEGLIAHELTHVAQGQAGISGIGDLSGDGLPDLVVSNIGSSGQDGVAVDVHGNWNFRHDRSHASLYKIEHGPPPGAMSPECLIWEVVGQVNGGPPGERIMQPQYGASAGAWDLSIAPMPWNAPETITVEVFSGGLSQGSVVGLAPGSVASGVSPAVPSSYQFELVVFDSATSTGLPANGVEHTFVWNSVISITLPGLAPLLGDELRVTALKAPTFKAVGTLPFINVDSVIITAATSASAPETTSLAVTGETVVLIDPCPADFTGDDSVNVTDLLQLLAAWGPCPAPPALCLPDTDGSGSVNVTDLLKLLAAWGACP